MSVLGGLTVATRPFLADCFELRYYIKVNNRAKSSAVTYGAGRLRYWPRDPTLSSNKSLLPVLALIVGNSTSSASTSLDVKFLVNKSSYARLDADEIGAADGAKLILRMRSTSPRLEIGMCASG